MGGKRKREILGGETYGAALMLIRVGYDMAFRFPEPTAIVLMLSLHPSRAAMIRQPEHLEVQPDVAVAEFIDAFGNPTTVDASCLLMPLVLFMGPTEPLWLSTLRAIAANLVDDSLVYRYKIGDAAANGLPGEEGTFCMGSFW